MDDRMELSKLYEVYKNSTGVTTDTRKIGQGNLFFALKGANFDGNTYSKEALSKGASAVVVDDVSLEGKEKHIYVEDVLKTLQQLANFHRKQFDIPFIGITGSNGKTTTKELISSVLRKKYKVFSTKGNFNNHIGVPLTLLEVDSTIEIAVIEMGANKVGDIAELVSIAEPTHGLITNIGKAHLEGFGSIEGVIRGKTELYDFLIKNEGRIFVNSLNPILSNMIRRMKDPVLYPQKQDYYSCEFLDASPYVKLKNEEGKEIQSQLIGKYNFENIAVALCIGKFFSVDSEQMADAIENYRPDNNRSQIIDRPNFRIILDAYNANPSSMEGALKDFLNIKSQKKAVILGDMNEVGETSVEEHEKLGKLVAESGVDRAIFVGEKMKDAHKVFLESKHFKDKRELEPYLKSFDANGYSILIKGSRSMGLEEVVKWLN